MKILIVVRRVNSIERPTIARCILLILSIFHRNLSQNLAVSQEMALIGKTLDPEFLVKVLPGRLVDT